MELIIVTFNSTSLISLTHCVTVKLLIETLKADFYCICLSGVITILPTFIYIKHLINNKIINFIY